MRSIVTWALSALLAVSFFGAAAEKFTAQPAMLQLFASFGMPMWFMYVTGVLEAIGAVLVLIPAVAGIGAGLLACVMAGAIISHLTHGQAAIVGPPIALFILALVTGSLRNWSRSTSAAAMQQTVS
jgi:putative oxidoreductase